jgi:hypothetical protein
MLAMPGGWVGPTTGLHDVEKPTWTETQPAVAQSLCRLLPGTGDAANIRTALLITFSAT